MRSFEERRDEMRREFRRSEITGVGILACIVIAASWAAYCAVKFVLHVLAANGVKGL